MLSNVTWSGSLNDCGYIWYVDCYHDLMFDNTVRDHCL
uniref:Uncharacterized protein n=1 Tax=viral metagenome TaxID=1070528 RepID=A0A6C0BMZ3_9ZZZZ